MPSTYTTNLGLEKPATGEQAGTWGVTANTSYDTIDAAIDGNTSITFAGSPLTLSTGNGGPPASGVNKVVLMTGSQSAAGVVNIAPNTAKKIYVMQNQTTGGFPVTIQQGTGNHFVLQPGYSAMVYADGGGAAANVFGALDSPQFTNVLCTGNLIVQGTITGGGGGGSGSAIYIDPANGNVTVGAASDQGARLAVVGGNPGQTVLGARGAANQTAPIWLGQNWLSQNLAVLDPSGNLTVLGQVSAAPFATLNQTGKTGNFLVSGTDGLTYEIGILNGILVAILPG